MSRYCPYCGGDLNPPYDPTAISPPDGCTCPTCELCGERVADLGMGLVGRYCERCGEKPYIRCEKCGYVQCVAAADWGEPVFVEVCEGGEFAGYRCPKCGEVAGEEVAADEA